MSKPTAPMLTDLPAATHRPSDEAPLRMRDHPFADNKPMLALAGAFVAMPLLIVLIRAVTDERPVVDTGTWWLIGIGVLLALLIIWYVRWLSTGIQVTVDGSKLRRIVERRESSDVTVPLSAIRAGVLASTVRYRRDSGAELVLFTDDDRVLWFADGLRPDDVRRIALALGDRNVKELRGPIGSDQLRALIRKLRRESATG